jgi:hypothetical protein
MQTISTKYLSPTNTQGARIKATHTGNFTSIIAGYDYSLNNDENQLAVALLLAQKLNWHGSSFIGGHTKGGMVWVNDSPHVIGFKVESDTL